LKEVIMRKKLIISIVSIVALGFLLSVLIFVLLYVHLVTDIKNWKFDYDVSQIETISIVNITGTSIDDRTTIVEIDINRADQLYTDIKSIKMRPYFGAPETPLGKCIIVTFVNGDFDVISQRWSERYRFDSKENRIEARGTYYFFDEDEFSVLIEKYMANDEEEKTGDG